MDVDDGHGELPAWDEKIARGARAAAGESMAKNDHESLRREFSIGHTLDNAGLGGSGMGMGGVG